MASNTSWIQEVSPAILEAAGMTGWGKIPSFPLDAVVEHLRQLFQSSSLSVEIGSAEWKIAENFSDGLGKTLFKTSLAASPLRGLAQWILPENSAKELLKSLKDQKLSAIKTEHPEVTKGIYDYLVLEVCQVVSKEYKGLSLHVNDEEFSTDIAYAIDIALHEAENVFWGRLLISKELQANLYKHFSQKRATLNDLEKLPNLMLPISITTGSTELTTAELENLRTGDFVVIENSHYNVLQKKGSFCALLQGKPLFQVKKRDRGIKIVDFIYFYEENTMDDDYFEDKQMDDDFSDGNIEFDDKDAEIPLDNKNDQEPSLEEEDMSASEEEALFGDIPEVKTGVKTTEKNPLENVSVSQIPVTVHMEVARINLSLDKLKTLAPGEYLPIEFNPSLVDLTVGGKSIGHGEIVEMGNLVGVKIIELYK